MASILNFSDVLTNLSCTKQHYKEILGVRGAWGDTDTLGRVLIRCFLVDIKFLIVDTGLSRNDGLDLVCNKVSSVCVCVCTVSLFV
jgi:hypothetical protein